MNYTVQRDFLALKKDMKVRISVYGEMVYVVEDNGKMVITPLLKIHSEESLHFDHTRKQYVAKCIWDLVESGIIA